MDRWLWFVSATCKIVRRGALSPSTQGARATCPSHITRSYPKNPQRPIFAPLDHQGTEKNMITQDVIIKIWFIFSIQNSADGDKSREDEKDKNSRSPPGGRSQENSPVGEPAKPRLNTKTAVSRNGNQKWATCNWRRKPKNFFFITRG